jgi:hypothetical protein
MPYVNLDDNYTEHIKIDSLSDAAFRLHTSGIVYAAKQLTDGKVPESRPTRLVPTFRAVALRELVDAGLWHPVGEGCGSKTCPAGEIDAYQIHDFLQWENKRLRDAERLAKWRAEHGSERGE